MNYIIFTSLAVCLFASLIMLALTLNLVPKNLGRHNGLINKASIFLHLCSDPKSFNDLFTDQRKETLRVLCKIRMYSFVLFVVSAVFGAVLSKL